MELSDGIRQEVLNDFYTALGKIDLAEKYNPDSAEFARALNIGLMWHLLRELGGCVDVPADVEQGEPPDEISGELSDAKKYIQRYIDTGDASFRDMAADELRHAGTLIKKANARLPGAEEKKRLKSYEAEMQEIAAQIDSAR